MTMNVDRRSLLTGGVSALCGLLPASAMGQADAPAAARFAAIRVDAAPLTARGGGASAALIQRIMPGKMRSVFADLVTQGARSGPTLIARIDTLYLSGYADAFSPGIDIQQMDTMDGAGLVLAGRQVQASTPLHVTLPASYSGAYYLPDIDARRIDSLCYQFAYWLRREMHL